MLEVPGRQLRQPLWLDDADLAHVLTAGLDEGEVADDLGVFAEEGGGGVDGDGVAVDEGAVAVRVFAGRVAEEAGGDGLADAVRVAAAAGDGKLERFHEAKQ